MELTDLEICRKVADIEDIHYMETKYKGNANFIALVSENDFTGTLPEMIGKYDPLNDDALCFGLLKKYNIDLISPYLPNNDTQYEAQIFINGIADALSEYDDNPNKAICLAIIEANK